jgi:hypothetical protein
MTRDSLSKAIVCNTAQYCFLDKPKFGEALQRAGNDVADVALKTKTHGKGLFFLRCAVLTIFLDKLPVGLNLLPGKKNDDGR